MPPDFVAGSQKSNGKFPIKKFQSADFDRVGRVRGNKLIFNFGLSITKMSDMSITVICHGMSDCTVSYTSTSNRKPRSLGHIFALKTLAIYDSFFD